MTLFEAVEAFFMQLKRTPGDDLDNYASFVGETPSGLTLMVLHVYTDRQEENYFELFLDDENCSGAQVNPYRPVVGATEEEVRTWLEKWKNKLGH